MPLTAAHLSRSLSNPSMLIRIARTGTSRSMGSSMLPQREQVLLRGAGLGPSAKLQRPACWTPLPARRPARVQTLSQPASRLLAPARALSGQTATRQAARGLWAATRQPQCRDWRMQLRGQLQVIQTM